METKEQTVSNLEKLDNAFEKERLTISNYLQENIYTKINNISLVADIQVHILSQRQKLVDKTSDLRTYLRKKQSNLQTLKKQKYRFYKLEYDLKLSDYEIKNHIESDLEDYTNMIKLLENQIMFYKESIEGLDKSVYMIKYLIEVGKFLNGN